MKQLISLDVFDTAIFRKVYNPTDIFNLVEDNIGHNFKASRILAQEKAHKKEIFCNLLDIYKQLDFPLSPKEEIKAELENCYANPYILDLYNNNEEADFIFISDMYLPSAVIKSMLEKCGYRNPEVYVSCELKACKGSGNLFTKVEKLLNRKIDKHIGDNYNVDIIGATRARILDVEYVGPAIYNKEVRTPALENVKLRKLLIDNELSMSPIEEKIGFLFSPLILSFTKAILNEAKEDQTIFFNARDGFIMYLVAKYVLKTNKKIKYCRFSRKSCYIPAIDTDKELTEDENRFILDFFRNQRCNSIREFLKTFKLNENKDYCEVLKKYKITLDSQIFFEANRANILKDTAIVAKEELYKIATREKANFLEYVRALGMKEGDIFVDLGYNGSMQAMLKRIAGINLKGRYIVTFSDLQEFKGIRIEKIAYIRKGLVGARGGVIEMVLSEPKGTVVSYENGKPIISKDVKFRKDITKKLLTGVIKGARTIIKEKLKVNVGDCENVLERFLSHPTLEEAAMANSSIFENGSFDKNESITWFNKELIKKGKIKDCYKKSYWKEAFKVLLKNSEYKDLEKIIG